MFKEATNFFRNCTKICGVSESHIVGVMLPSIMRCLKILNFIITISKVIGTILTSKKVFQTSKICWIDNIKRRRREI